MSMTSYTPVEDQRTSLPERRIALRTSIAYATAAALLLRIAIIFVFQTYGFATSENHYLFGFETGSIAASLATGGGFSSPFGVATGPTTWIAPVYPTLVAAAFKIFGLFSTASAIAILSLNSLFGALTVPVIYRIGRRVFDERSGEIAAWIWAVVPFFARWPVTWIWETALAALLCAVLFCYSQELETSSWQAWMGLGVLWGFTGLTSPSLLGFLPCSMLYPACRLKRKPWTAASRVLIAAFFFVATISPWLARNEAVFHKPIFLRGNFWFETSISNFHTSFGEAWSGLHPAVNPRILKHYQSVGEVAFVEEAKQRVFGFIRSYPDEFLRLVETRVANFWDGEELMYEVLSDPFKPWMVALTSGLAFAGLLFAIGSRREWGLFGGLLLLFPVPYYMTYTNPRYRHPIEPLMVVLTGYFFAEVYDVYSRRRSAKP